MPPYDAEWHRERYKSVGATLAGKLLGTHDFGGTLREEFNRYLAVSRGQEPYWINDAPGPDAKRGSITEREHIELLNESGVICERWPQDQILRHKDLHCIPDAITQDGLPVSLKCPRPWKAARMKYTGLSEHYHADAQAMLGTYRRQDRPVRSQAKTIIVSVYNVELAEVHVVPVEYDYAMYENLERIASAWMRAVTVGQFPDWCMEPPTDQVVYDAGDVPVVDPDQYPAVADAMERVAEAQEMAALVKDHEAEAKALLSGWLKERGCKSVIVRGVGRLTLVQGRSADRVDQDAMLARWPESRELIIPGKSYDYPRVTRVQKENANAAQ